MIIEQARALIAIEQQRLNLRGQKQRILRGLQILAKYDDNIGCSFEHDQMWASDFERTAGAMTEEEVTELAKMGWFEDQDFWSHF